MPKVFFIQEHRQVEVDPGRTIKSIALEVGIDPNRKYQRLISCEGRGIFDGCKCWVKDLGTFTHVVKKGENLSLVAAEYGTNAWTIAGLNGMGHDFGVKVGQVLKIPSMNPQTFSERALHTLKGWQRLACQARVLRGDVEVYTLPQGDERLREPRPIASVPARPGRRERFLESRFRADAPADDDGEAAEKPKAAKPAPSAAIPPAAIRPTPAAQATPQPAPEPASRPSITLAGLAPAAVGHPAPIERPSEEKPVAAQKATAERAQTDDAGTADAADAVDRSKV